ncbi:hypothetical protein [Pseudomonas aeruginosa]|uniref:hypothetical protein n=1 Tax=Pseudomonas aeruginosa TaxID=287 RepID=UPI0015E7883D|nr:hypothetical protein [Pseudomonas aeruginosa]HCT4783672.1 hypothetical protein [Pseudomonas aeruginosa]
MKTREIETAIITQAAKSLIEAGHFIHVFDGAELAGAKTQDLDAIMRECFATDMTSFYVYGAPSPVGAEAPSLDKLTALGWVQFVHGNGVDVMADYTVNLESLLQAASDLADSYE